VGEGEREKERERERKRESSRGQHKNDILVKGKIFEL
jgi:hypothetical protein